MSAAIVLNMGDATSREVKPDFDSGRGYYWMKAVRQAEANGAYDKLPRRPKPAPGTAQASWDAQVRSRLARRNYGGFGISFDKNGKVIRDVEDIIA
jgi:hypothetical protein